MKRFILVFCAVLVAIALYLRDDDSLQQPEPTLRLHPPEQCKKSAEQQRLEGYAIICLQKDQS